VSEPQPEPEPATETPEQKRERVMRRLAEIIRAGPPDLSGSGTGPVSAGGFPVLPGSADEFDQESAAELLGALSRFFELNKRGEEDREKE
jgi:hypothetical protein